MIAVTDAVRIRQILDGLADNALRVVGPGAPIVFALKRDERDGAAVLQVRDGGPGLTPEDCAVAFDRSAPMTGTGEPGGSWTGIGLALVGGLASRLGATAEAGRAPEGGAAFTIRLPA